MEPVQEEYQHPVADPASQRRYPYPGSLNDGLFPFKTETSERPFLSDYTIAPCVNELSNVLKLQKTVGLPLTKPGKLAKAKSLSKQASLKARLDPGVLCTTAREINRTAKAVQWLDEDAENG